MQYYALASDYDGTIATHGLVDDSTITALKQFQESGRRLIMVTGRLLEELLGIFPSVTLFDRIIAENGAVSYSPLTQEVRALGATPKPEFVECLRQRNVHPLSVGRVIVATVEPYQSLVQEAILELGVNAEVIYNKGAVMVLPRGITKASGLREALQELQLSPEQVVGVGDAENDQAFLELCGFSAAVANALPVVKATVDYVAQQTHGAGVAEVMAKILREDGVTAIPAVQGNSTTR